MFPFLTLDQSTLFYWTLSDVPPKRGSAINEWASTIPSHSKPTFQGPKSISSRTKSIPSLIGGRTDSGSRSSANSVLTNTIKVISHHQAPVKVKAESQAHVLSLSDGGLSDNDELAGKEREIAINSPPKGKKRITSEVRSQLSKTQIVPRYLILFLSSNSYLKNLQRNQHPKSLETRNYPIGLKLNGSGTPLSQLIWRL